MNTKSSIEDYLLIGGLRSSALVSKAGSIDWLCLPYFDSPSVFARLLGPDGGSFSIDTTGYTTTSGYVTQTAIAETILKDYDTEIILHDFMVPLDSSNIEASQYLVRKIDCRKGSAELVFTLNLQPNYARDKVEWQQKGNQLVTVCGDGSLVLHVPKRAHLRQTESGYEIILKLAKGETEELTLEYQTKQAVAELPANLEKLTSDFWHAWVAKGNFADFCRDNLVRSAITLKLLQFAPTGAIVAAPTTSLPEVIGGVRNWDYRYVWIRDATFTLYAFHVLGYHTEAERFFEFIHGVLEKCSHKQFDVSLMYTIFGEPVPSETVAGSLSGYEESRPVRVGNGAAEQFQLDVYGSLVDAIYFATKRGIANEHKARMRELVMNLVKKIEQKWQEPDSGIWEVRSGRQQFTYSKVMSWVGADRAERMNEVLGFSNGELGVCQNLAGDIKDWIWRNSYQPEAKNFSQYPGTDAVDATNLLFVLLQFLDKHDPKTNQVIANTAQALAHQEVFMDRYRSTDGLPGKEGAFVLCSFWLISVLAIIEDTDQALRLFKRMEKYLSPSGLIAEEIDVETSKYLGNYPQAFSHVGYIMSAYYIDKYMKRQELKQ